MPRPASPSQREIRTSALLLSPSDTRGRIIERAGTFILHLEDAHYLGNTAAPFRIVTCRNSAGSGTLALGWGMRVDQDELDGIIAAIERAPYSEDGWQIALEGAVRAAGGWGVQMLAQSVAGEMY